MANNRYILCALARVSALILVLIAHISQVSNLPFGGFFGLKNFYYVSLGGAGVTIFLVLSGIFLQLNYKNQEIPFLPFLKKRIIRIYPIYYLI